MLISKKSILNIFTNTLTTNLIEDAYSYIIGLNINYFNNIDIIKDDSISHASDSVYIPELLCNICKNCRIDSKLVNVAFSDQIKTAGSIIKNTLGSYDVRISMKFKNKFKAIGGILAHEIMHIWVEKYYSNSIVTEINERMTDIMTVLNGCGILLIRANEEVSESPTDKISEYADKNMIVGHYISVEELGYAFVLFAKAKDISPLTFQNDFSPRNRYLIERGLDYYARRKKELKGIEISKVRKVCNKCFKILQYDYRVMSRKSKIKCPKCGNIEATE